MNFKPAFYFLLATFIFLSFSATAANQGLAWHSTTLVEATVKGLDESQYVMSQIYSEGKYVKKDLAEARKWLEKAAAQGNQEAKQVLEKL